MPDRINARGSLMPPIFFRTRLGYTRAQIGQRIKFWTGTVDHHGIVTGFTYDPATNTPHALITHTAPGLGVSETSQYEFCGYGLFEIVDEPKSLDHLRMILATAKKNIGMPYSLFQGNCEQFASYCYTHRAESPQLQSAVAATLLVSAAVLICHASRD